MKSTLAFKLLATKIRKLHFEAIAEPPREEIINLGVSIGHGFQYISKEKTLVVLIGVDISGEDAPFKMKMEFEGLFVLNRKATKKEVEPLARVNCSATLFPYVRETVAEITRRAGYAPLHLGSMNFVEFFKKLKTESSQEKKS